MSGQFMLLLDAIGKLQGNFMQHGDIDNEISSVSPCQFHQKWFTCLFSTSDNRQTQSWVLKFKSSEKH